MCFPVPSSFLCEEHPKTSVSSVKRRLANGGIYGSCDGGGSGSGSVWICLDLSSNVQIVPCEGLKALMPCGRVNVHLLQACRYIPGTVNIT